MKNEKSGSGQNMGGSKSRTQGAYDESLAGDFHSLSKRLGIPLSVMIGWRKNEEKVSGWLSCPVTREEYATLVILSERLWCNPFLLRMQLSKLTPALQEFVVRGAGLSWVESVVFEDLLRLKILKEKQAIQFTSYQQWFQTRYPNGFQQLTSDLYQKIANRASDTIKSAKKDGKYQLLVESLRLGYGDENAEMQECQNKQIQNPTVQSEPSGHLVDKVESDKAEVKYRQKIKSDDADTDIEDVVLWPDFKSWAFQFCLSPLIHKLNLEHKQRELYKNKKKDDDDKDDPEKK